MRYMIVISLTNDTVSTTFVTCNFLSDMKRLLFFVHCMQVTRLSVYLSIRRVA